MSGRPKVTSQRDDHLTKWMVVRSPTSLNKIIGLMLLLKGTAAGAIQGRPNYLV